MKLIVGDLDICTLSDEKLYRQLEEFGGPVGPIVDSTRGLYQYRLYRLLQGVGPEEEQSSDNSDVDVEGYDDDEDGTKLQSHELLSHSTGEFQYHGSHYDATPYQRTIPEKRDVSPSFQSRLVRKPVRANKRSLARDILLRLVQLIVAVVLGYFGYYFYQGISTLSVQDAKEDTLRESVKTLHDDD